MNKILKIGMIVAVVLGFTACYNDFDEPAPTKYYTAADFEGCTPISIKALKQLFYDQYGNGTNSLAKTYEVTEDYVISGKVISSDRAGNVYKSVYIYDESSESAIELKLMVSNYVYYHLGQTIFVKVKGLAIGNYRYNLSIGSMPSATDIANGYANSNIDTRNQLDSHVFIGQLGELTAADTLVVNASNYNTLTDNDLGRLIRFEGLKYSAGTFDGDRYPQYLQVTYPNNQTTAVYENKYYEEENLTPTYAYSYGNDKYYGSSWFTYDATGKPAAGNYIVRVSGYADFADIALPESGTKVNLTAIFNKYSSKSGGFVKYQLLLNSVAGVQIVE